ncbi:MAG: hypothetical protein NVS3B26_11660 [Mycobacteriales bacterium]
MRNVAADIASGNASTPLSSLITTLMRERQLTLREVAERGGLSIAAVAALRSADRGKRPRQETLERLARGLSISIDVMESAVRPADGHRQVRLLELFNNLSPDGQLQVLLNAEEVLEQEGAQSAE